MSKHVTISRSEAADRTSTGYVAIHPLDPDDAPITAAMRHGQLQQGGAIRNRSPRAVRRSHGERIATRRRDIRSRHPRRHTGTLGTSCGLAVRRGGGSPARWLV
jgi:hypothetical protein